MSIVINTNLSSMLGIASLNRNTNAMNKALERLSTGYRINSSKDDAAGSAISTYLIKDISSLDVAQSNAQMGQSMIDTANGALGNISNMLQRIRDLAEQSANGTYGIDERKAMQTEAQNLVSEIYRINNSTEFNGKKILGVEEKTAISEEEAEDQGYTVVKTAQKLKEALVANDPSCKVILFADINLNDLDLDETGSNWTAVGDYSNKFKGTLDGNGFSISNLKINKSNANEQGLIGLAIGATIKNLELDNVNVKGKDSTGALVGVCDDTEISNCEVSGTVEGYGNTTGGLVGRNDSGSVIKDCIVSSKVIGHSYHTGGIAGSNFNNSVIDNCTVSANVTGAEWHTGGIVGVNYNKSEIKNCISTATVNGNLNVGGIAGMNYNLAVIDNCGVSANVTGNEYVGGLVGITQVSAKVMNTKTTSVVNSTSPLKGAIFGRFDDGTLSGNEYNSTINGEMKPVGAGLDNPTEEQIKDNQSLNVSSSIQPYPDENNADTCINLQVGIKNDDTSVITVDTGFDIGCFNVSLSTEYGAKMTLKKVDVLMSKIIQKQTELGTASNRLDTAIDYQNIQSTTKVATNSVIKDADFAEESSNYVKQQILQQTTSTLLSTANQNPNIALMLVSTKNDSFLSKNNAKSKKSDVNFVKQS